jgi:dihydroorotate dehydrogenase (fumarate)
MTMNTHLDSIDLTTPYLGMRLRNPIVASASPLSENLDNIRRMEDAGAAAVVMHSLFEEQLTRESHRLDHYLDYGTESFAEALSYFPEASSYHVGPDAYLEKLVQAKEAVDIPVIASLNGISTGGWTRYARLFEESGVDAIELNVYYIPTNPQMRGADVDEVYLSVVRAVKQHITIPLAVKLGPFFSAPASIVQQMADLGAGAVVLFNRFYQPDIDIEALDVVPRATLSTSTDLLLPLRWVAIMYGRVDIDLAITGGVHSHEDVLKSMMAGANVAMVASEILKYGIDRIGEMLADLHQWMESHEYLSIDQMRGSMSQRHVTEPTAFERANYMRVLQSWRPDIAGISAG